jgi:hypothetical protein
MGHGIFPNYGKALQMEIRKALSKKEFKEVFYPEKKKKLTTPQKVRRGGEDD